MNRVRFPSNFPNSLVTWSFETEKSNCWHDPKAKIVEMALPCHHASSTCLKPSVVDYTKPPLYPSRLTRLLTWASHRRKSVERLLRLYRNFRFELPNTYECYCLRYEPCTVASSISIYIYTWHTMNPIDILFIGEYPLLYVETRRIRLVFMFMVHSTLPRLNIYLETRKRCESLLIILLKVHSITNRIRQRN